MSRGPTVIPVAWLLVAVATYAADRSSYDPQQWEAVEVRQVDFGAPVGTADVTLLRARPVTGESGLGDPLHDANLIISRGDELLFRWKGEPPRRRDETDERFLLDGEQLDVRDVTADGRPEVILRTGDQGASSTVWAVHVIHYDRKRRAFRDVGVKAFRADDWGDEVRWMDFDGRAVAITAHAVVARDECHACPHRFEYGAWCWESAADAFVRVYTSRTADPTPPESPLADDLPRMLPAIREHAKHACAAPRP